MRVAAVPRGREEGRAPLCACGKAWKELLREKRGRARDACMHVCSGREKGCMAGAWWVHGGCMVGAWWVEDGGQGRDISAACQGKWGGVA
eukprot:220043-Chlamydomonas_euryale.AAC.2